MTDLLRYPCLIFFCPLRQTQQFLRGRLELQYDKTEIIGCPAASGLRTFQHEDCLWTRSKGPIPLSEQIKGNYRVSTEQIYSPKSQSEAFHIEPDPVLCFPDLLVCAGVARVRSQLLIHRRGQYNGTNGCIEICDDPDFDDFALRMNTFREKRILYLPLWVVRLQPSAKTLPE